MAEDTNELVLFHYRDAQGRDVVTNDVASVPPQFRDRLQPYELERPAREPLPTELGGLHLPSALLGAAVASVVVAALVMRRRSALVRIATLLASVALVGALYFGWVMRTAGLGAGAFADPRDAVHEAQRAKDAANARTQALERINEAER